MEFFSLGTERLPTLEEKQVYQYIASIVRGRRNYSTSKIYEVIVVYLVLDLIQLKSLGVSSSVIFFFLLAARSANFRYRSGNLQR